MQAKNAVILLSILILLSGLSHSSGALPIESLSMTGEGVTINLTFPSEAHPLDSITHNLTITANTGLTMDFTIFIYAPVNSIWQEVRNQTLTGYSLPENGTFTSRLGFTLPQEANGALYCVLNVSTDVNNKDVSAVLYTTRVSTLNFDEMQTLYNEMLANYTELQANYTTLLNEYDSLFANYSSLFDNYTILFSQYNQLSTEYDDKVKAYQTLSDNYDALLSKYNSLNTNFTSKTKAYNDLNSTYNSLQENYTKLQADYDELNQTYTGLQEKLDNLQTDLNNSQNAVNTDRIVMFIFVITLVALIAFIIYLKRGKEEPYVVIRKETVSMNQDENS
jgi:predicted nuclease with TOPRIM domain